MQPPAVVFNDNRWIVGFAQNYLSVSSSDLRYTMFAAQSSPSTGLFGGFGSSLAVIDDGSGLRPDVTAASSRYVRFAPFPNGDVLAVYMAEREFPGLPITPTTVRVVFANIYDALTHEWGLAKQLGTFDITTTALTDTGTDGSFLGGSWVTQFCRPSAAASANGTAMVAWCEHPFSGPSQFAQPMYAYYHGGVWDTATSLVTGSNASLYVNPGWTGQFYQTNGFGLNFNAGTQYEQDFYSQLVDINTTSTMYGAVVKGVSTTPTAGEFQIVTDAFGNVLTCESMQAMTTALLSTPTTQVQSFAIGTGPVQKTFTPTSTTLAQLGMSYVLDPTCNDGVGSTQNITAYYNRSLKNVFRKGVKTSSTDYVENVVGRLTVGGGGIFGNVPGAVLPDLSTQFVTSEETWYRSAMVEVAGDAYGNFAMVRSAVAPLLQANDITTGGIRKARMLFGHQFVPGPGWLNRTGAAPGFREPAVSFVSHIPSCFNGTDYFECSVRDPKFLMSSSGKGLVFFHALTYDTFNGFGNLQQVDANLTPTGSSMHPAVAINSKGDVAVAWENVQSFAEKDVWVAVWSGGVWSAPVQANSTAFNNSKNVMMPSVGINDSKQVIVTFSYDPVDVATGASPNRRQMVSQLQF
jgi:hypothetical protein